MCSESTFPQEFFLGIYSSSPAKDILRILTHNSPPNGGFL